MSVAVGVDVGATKLAAARVDTRDGRILAALRRHPSWTSHVRNRGLASTDEIEIVLARDFSKPAPFSLRR